MNKHDICNIGALALALGALDVLTLEPAALAATTPSWVAGLTRHAAQISNSTTAQTIDGLTIYLSNIITEGTAATPEEVTSLWCSNTDVTNASTIDLILQIGTNYYPEGSVVVPAAAGINGNAATSLLGSAAGVNVPSSIIPGVDVNEQGNPHLILLASDTLAIAATGTVVSGKFVSCIAQGRTT